MFDSIGNEGTPNREYFELELDEAAMVTAVLSAKEFNPKIDTSGNEVASFVTPEIRGNALRNLVMGLPLRLKDGSTIPNPVIPQQGVLIRNVRFKDDLDLTGLRSRDGSSFPALELENCDFAGDIIISRGHYRYLSLAGSKFRHLKARDLLVEGSICLDDVGGSTKAGHPPPPIGCHLDLDGLQLKGGLSLERGLFYSGPENEDSARDSSPLFLRDARIGGTVALGGAKFLLNIPDGNSGRYFPALNLCGATIGGDLELNRNLLTVSGTGIDETVRFIMLEQTHVKGDLMCSEMEVKGVGHESKKPALQFDMVGLNVSGNLNIYGLKLDGSIRALGLTIGGNLELFTCVVDGDIDLVNAEIGGDFLVDYRIHVNTLNAYLISVKRDIKFQTEGSKYGFADIKYLMLDNASVSGSVKLDSIYGDEVSLRGAKIRNTLAIKDCIIATPGQKYSETFKISLDEKALYFKNGAKMYVADGRVYNYHENLYFDVKSKTYGDFSVAAARLVYPVGEAFALKKSGDALVGGRLIANIITGDFDFQKEKPETLKRWFDSFIAQDGRVSKFVDFLEHKGSENTELVKSLRNLKDESERVQAIVDRYGATFTQLFLSFIKSIIDEELHTEVCLTFKRWKDVDASKIDQKPNWDLYGVETRELDDSDGRGYGFGKLQLDEFKYDHILSREPVSVDNLSGTARRKISLAGKIWKAVSRRLLNVAVTIQNALLAIKADLILYFVYLFILAVSFTILLLTPVSPVWATPVITAFYGNFQAIALGTIGIGIIGWAIGKEFKPSLASLRKKWLRQQYVDPNLPKASEFRPFPYEELARYMRARGFDKDSRKILIEKLTIDRKLSALFALRPLSLLFHIGFEYGLSPRRALTTFLICMFVGFLGFLQADRGYILDPSIPEHMHIRLPQPPCSRATPPQECSAVMSVSTNTVNTTALMSGKQSEVSSGVRAAMPIYDQSAPSGGQRAAEVEIPCKDKIQASLYAIDVFIPAVDLHQETQCEISDKPDFLAWRWAKAVYSLLGWLVTSLLILTISGILRRQVES